MSVRQHGATICKPVLPGHLVDLTALLKQIGDDIMRYRDIPFALLDTVHFMGWFIVRVSDTDHMLCLELNVDGPVSDFLQSLVIEGGSGVDAIYRHCSGYPALGSGAPDEVVQYLLRSDIGYNCYYICWRGLTVERIRRERALRVRLEACLDQQDSATLQGMQPGAIRALLQDVVNDDGSLDWARTAPPRPFLVRYRKTVLTVLAALGIGLLLGLLAAAVISVHKQGVWPVAALVAALLAVAGTLLATLRWHESHDAESSAEPDHAGVMAVVTQENRVVQNHFASVVQLKPGPFRRMVLKGVLALIHVLAAVSSNQGDLSGIKSIHFARWVVLPGGTQLLFLSNYDGSWENYLDDFIDQASNGLTAIWSNSEGFPRTRWLVNGGARNEILFKTLVRQSQTASLVWYSAYPDLSTTNIQRNAAIREGLFASLDPAAEAAWLSNF